MPHQEALTVVDQIKPGQVDALKGLLGTLASHRGTWDVIPFKSLSNVHFARLVVFDETKDLDGHVVPARLALLTDVDAPLDGHLHELATISGDGLDRVFGHCQGFPAPAARSPDSRDGLSAATRGAEPRVLCESLWPIRATNQTRG